MAAGTPVFSTTPCPEFASGQARKRQKLLPGQQCEADCTQLESRLSDGPVTSTPDSQMAGLSSDTDTQDLGSDQEGELGDAPAPNAKPGASFARAFAKILSQPQSAAPKVVPAKATHSTGLQEQSAHHLRQNLRRRDHMRLGEDAVHDATEKALMKTATRGVVQLFNAVSAAQHRKTVSRGPRTAQAPEVAHIQALAKESTQQQPGWDILRAGHDPFSEKGGTRLRDWNQAQAGSDSEARP